MHSQQLLQYPEAKCYIVKNDVVFRVFETEARGALTLSSTAFTLSPAPILEICISARYKQCDLQTNMIPSHINLRWVI